ncbi:MAG: LptF/LptG family permease [Elusimicrobiota bacterium]
MKILNKYILAEFLKSVAFCLLLFCVLFMISEFLFRLHEFIAYKANVEFIALYLRVHVPMWIRDTMPVAVLMATVFTLNKFVRSGEITAVKSCGIDVFVLLLPVFLAAFLFSIFVFILNTKAVPWSFRSSRYLRETVLYGRQPLSGIRNKNLEYTDRQGRQFLIREFDLSVNAAFDVTIDYLNEKHIPEMQVRAEKMLFEKGAWVLRNAVITKFMEGRKILSQKKEKSMPCDFDFTPEDILPVGNAPDEMSMDEMSGTELNIRIKKSARRGIKAVRELVAYHIRFSYAFSNLVVMFIGIPFALGLSGRYAKVRGVAWVIVVSFTYWILISLGRVLGEARILEPFIAAWLANIIFLSGGFYLFSKTLR